MHIVQRERPIEDNVSAGPYGNVVSGSIVRNLQWKARNCRLVTDDGSAKTAGRSAATARSGRVASLGVVVDGKLQSAQTNCAGWSDNFRICSLHNCASATVGSDKPRPQAIPHPFAEATTAPPTVTPAVPNKSSPTMLEVAQSFILGLGGTTRAGSSSERALRVSIEAAQAEGAETSMLRGCDLSLPMYSPAERWRTPEADRLVALLRRCDGLIIASPSYHGGVSGLVKNALDYTEDLSGDERAYLDGIAVGLIVCAAGWQGAVQTLGALRAIVHSLRGWPTPLGAVLNTAQPAFDGQGFCVDPTTKVQLETVGRQVVRFSEMWRLHARLQHARASAQPPAV
jgi:FMN reductase